MLSLRLRNDDDVSDSLYITSTTIRAGKAVVALGTLETLARQVGRIGVFRPIVDDARDQDVLLHLLADRYQVGVDHAIGLTYAAAASYVDESGDSRLVAHLVDEFMHMKDAYDFVLVIGSDFTGPSPATELALNARLAANMGAPVLAVVSGHDLDEAGIEHAMDSSTSQLTRLGCSIVATIVNRVDPAIVERGAGPSGRRGARSAGVRPARPAGPVGADGGGGGRRTAR